MVDNFPKFDNMIRPMKNYNEQNYIKTSNSTEDTEQSDEGSGVELLELQPYPLGIPVKSGSLTINELITNDDDSDTHDYSLMCDGHVIANYEDIVGNLESANEIITIDKSLIDNLSSHIITVTYMGEGTRLTFDYISVRLSIEYNVNFINMGADILGNEMLI